MVRDGYKSITIDEKTYNQLRKIEDEMILMSIPETIRMLIREFRRKQ